MCVSDIVCFVQISRSNGNSIEPVQAHQTAQSRGENLKSGPCSHGHKKTRTSAADSAENSGSVFLFSIHPSPARSKGGLCVLEKRPILSSSRESADGFLHLFLGSFWSLFVVRRPTIGKTNEAPAAEKVAVMDLLHVFANSKDRRSLSVSCASKSPGSSNPHQAERSLPLIGASI